MKNKWVVFGVLIAIIVIVALGINQILILRNAHSTFDNYYAFRGCTRLISQTDNYGTCELASGKIIKIVKFRDKWYLEGDLPSCWSNFCF